MKKTFNVKPRINKINGQWNVSLPKKEMPKKLLKSNPRNIKLKIVGWE